MITTQQDTTEKAIKVAELALNYLFVVGLEGEGMYRHLKLKVEEMKEEHSKTKLYLARSGL